LGIVIRQAYQREDGLTSEALSNEEVRGEAVARIGDCEITADDILNCLILRKNWQAVEECLDQFLIEEAFKRYSIEVLDEEVGHFVTAFRQKNQMLSSEDTLAWLEKHHLDDDDFLELCQFDLKLEKLKDKLFQDKLEEVFAYKRQSLQTVEIYKIVVANEEAALEIVSSVNEGASFFDYARKYSVDHETAKSCGYVGHVKVQELPAAVQDLLIKGAQGEVLGPVKVNKNFEVYLLESMQIPVLDDDCRRHLLDDLFAEWLADTKTRANMELFI
jgi:parvulin-like peptidyl-prolyl isomerase